VKKQSAKYEKEKNENSRMVKMVLQLKYQKQKSKCPGKTFSIGHAEEILAN